jgi:thiopeptide-type bacteriocin biosynthesis protein
MRHPYRCRIRLQLFRRPYTFGRSHQIPMKITFAENLLLRTPAKSWRDGLNHDRQEILDDPFFQLALYLASPDFYEKINRAAFKYEQLSDREQLTIERYLNRMSYRPTPFGLFAAVSLISWGSETCLEIPDESFGLTALPDQAYILAMGSELLLNEFSAISLYRPNFTIYRGQNEYRFIRTSVNDVKSQREYLLQATVFSKTLKDLLLFGSEGRSKPDIIKFIIENWHCSAEEGRAYFEFLADAQLLINTINPNITGENHLQYLLHKLSAKGISSARTRLLEKLFRSLDAPKISPVFFIDTSWSLRKALTKNTGIGEIQTPRFNVILRRQFQGRLDRKLQDQIKDGLFALDRLCPPDNIPNLAEFAKAFEKHFEGQSLPLLHVIDPETGIGYLDRSSNSLNPLLETVNIPVHTNSRNNLNWTTAHSYLLDSWQKNLSDKKRVIHLTQEDLNHINKSNESPVVQGLSVLFRIVNDQLYLENAGGVNAPALMGRFTVEEKDITEAAIKIASDQEGTNPDIIFAELLHLSDPHIDNVNQRERIWSWELPVTATSLNDAGGQLELSDLRVSIIDGKVVLWSEKHHKMVMPRLTSAYNHSLNKLPLFRFLADVSYQFGRSSLSFDMRWYFPGVSFYPMVIYKNTILHLATWILNQSEIESLQKGDASEIIIAFECLSTAIGLPEMFSLAEGDQQLIFKRDEDQDKLFFAACLKQKKEAVLKEYFEDSIGNGFVNQFNAFVYAAEPILVPSLPHVPTMLRRQQRKFVPGSAWLYLKIYSTKISAAKLLLKVIPLLRKKYKHGKIKRWFFIRYEDHAPHIRLRIQVSPLDIGELLVDFKVRLENSINQHVIREYQVDTYNRELERYAAAGMDRTEDFFWASSELVVSYLKRNRYQITTTAHLFALYTLQVIINAFITDPEEQLMFLLESYRQFLPEFSEGKLKMALDRKYRELTPEIHQAMKTADLNFWTGSVKTDKIFAGMVKGLSIHVAADHNDKTYYLRSIIHMHLNRLFTDDSRKQEMVTYYLLYKYLLSLKGRNKR